MLWLPFKLMMVSIIPWNRSVSDAIILVQLGKQKVSSFWSQHASPQTSTSAFLILIFFCAMKRCPIAAKIAGSSGILPCRALNDFFT